MGYDSVLRRPGAPRASTAKAGLRPSEYIISPRDLAGWARGLRLRDAMGFGLMLAAALIVALWLQDLGAGLFAAGLVLAMWWHVDSRWAFGAALVLLVVIPLMQYTYDRNWLYSGAALAGGLAVTVWYLLAIGVVRAVAELRRAPAAANGASPAEISAGETAPPPAVKPIAAGAAPAEVDKPGAAPPPPTRRRQPVAPTSRPPVAPASHPAAQPAAVPSWRRRLSAIEAETREPARRPSLDGLRGRRR